MKTLTKIVLLGIALTSFSAMAQDIYWPAKIHCDKDAFIDSCHMEDNGMLVYFQGSMSEAGIIEAGDYVFEWTKLPYQLPPVSGSYIGYGMYVKNNGAIKKHIQVRASEGYKLSAFYRSGSQWQIDGYFGTCTSSNPTDCPAAIENKVG